MDPGLTAQLAGAAPDLPYGFVVVIEEVDFNFKYNLVRVACPVYNAA